MAEELYRKGPLEDNLNTKQTRALEAHVLYILLDRFGIVWAITGKLESRSFAGSLYRRGSISKTWKSRGFLFP